MYLFICFIYLLICECVHCFQGAYFKIYSSAGTAYNFLNIASLKSLQHIMCALIGLFLY